MSTPHKCPVRDECHCRPGYRHREGTLGLGRFFELQTASRPNADDYAYVTLVCPWFEFAVLGPGHKWKLFWQGYSDLMIGGHTIVGPFSFEWYGPQMWQVCMASWRKYGL